MFSRKKEIYGKDKYDREKEFLMLFAYDNVLPNLDKKVENRLKRKSNIYILGKKTYNNSVIFS